MVHELLLFLSLWLCLSTSGRGSTEKGFIHDPPEGFTEKIAKQLLISSYSQEFVDYVIQRRRQLHQIPELMFEERLTSTYVKQQLLDLGVQDIEEVAGTGVVARIQIGSGDGPTVALRADIDALPIAEPLAADVDRDEERSGSCAGPAGPRTGSEWLGPLVRSRHEGRMHACGHDAHMAMLLGAVRLLVQWNENQAAGAAVAAGAPVSGSVLAVFQPAEEGGGGAKEVLAAGALRGVAAIHGMHMWPALPAGQYSTKPGVIMAASDRFQFRIQGRGGHGAIPNLAADPVVAGAAAVMAVQTLISRETSPLDGAVVTVSRFNTGPGASNVIPDSVQIQGTLRALTDETFARLRRRLREVVGGSVAALGCWVEDWSWSEVPYPPTRNDVTLANSVADTAKALAAAAAELFPAPSSVQIQSTTACSVGCSSDSTALDEAAEKEAAVTLPILDGGFRLVSPSFSWLGEPSMAAEDFSFYGQEIPAVFSFLGSGDPDLGTDAGLHSPLYRAHDGALALGAAAHAGVALTWLAGLTRAAHLPPSLVSSNP